MIIDLNGWPRPTHQKRYFSKDNDTITLSVSYFNFSTAKILLEYNSILATKKQDQK
ncbi:hypothetical protein MSP8886_03938 [Marinomonas spartinae]|uniref:Uncharacterized protein n=1 Tax=Marinomonas spartinae TaxID=1792290 RepID=A0A1A8TUR8_9GAMM|nr:hypothetical protein MSP8886_03938 [Marinomonas spartinae]